MVELDISISRNRSCDLGKMGMMPDVNTGASETPSAEMTPDANTGASEH